MQCINKLYLYGYWIGFMLFTASPLQSSRASLAEEESPRPTLVSPTVKDGKGSEW